MTDVYQWWRDALAGKAPNIDINTPQPGFYKVRRGANAPWQPVAIWPGESGALICRVADKVCNANDVWSWCAKNPVKQADAKIAFETGSWPGDVSEPPPPGHNAPPSSVEDRIGDVAGQALDWLTKHGITDDASSNMAANYRQQLLDLAKEADEHRVKEKAPHDKAGKAVQAKWKPVIDRARDTAGQLRDALTHWMRAAKRKAEAEAAAQAKAAEASDGSPPPAPEIKIQAGGQRGRKTGLRTIKTPVVVDYDAAFEHFRGHSAMRALIDRLAVEAFRSGETAPGVKVETQEVAA